MLGLLLIAELVDGGTALAAGAGYGPSSPPPSATAAGFTNIVTTQTFPESGGTVSGSANGATATVTVPAGSAPDGAQVVVSAGPPTSIDVGSGNSVIADFSVVLLDPSTGTKLTGPFNPPVSITISDPSIGVGDTVVIVTGPGETSTVSGAQISQGEATVTFTTDPNFAVVSSKASGEVVAGATSVVTGEPFLGEELLAGVFVSLGAAGLFVSITRRRRQKLT